MIQTSAYGRLGRAPKPGTTKEGKPMCTGSIAVDIGREQGQETLWVSLMAFGQHAEALGKHQPGDMLAATGKLTRGRYTGKDGQEHESWSLLVESLHSSRTVRPSAPRREAGGTKASNPPRRDEWAPYPQQNESRHESARGHQP